MRGRWDLNDKQWEAWEPILRPKRREDNRGRPWHDTRAVLNGVLWVLGSGAQWREPPERYPPYQTCRRRFQQWVKTGKLEEALSVLAHDLRERGQLKLAEAFVHLRERKKGGLAIGPSGADRERETGAMV
ncbi:MAG: transposase [Bryobacter sp.]|nr:transposase [Bryobacter sp. CoA8 C33]